MSIPAPLNTSSTPSDLSECSDPFRLFFSIKKQLTEQKNPTLQESGSSVILFLFFGKASLHRRFFEGLLMTRSVATTSPPC